MPDRTTPTDQGAPERAEIEALRRGVQEGVEAAMADLSLAEREALAAALAVASLPGPHRSRTEKLRLHAKKWLTVGFVAGCDAANQAPEVTEAAVERAARAMWDYIDRRTYLGANESRMSWVELPEHGRADQRKLARAVLTAAFSPSSDTGEPGA